MFKNTRADLRISERERSRLERCSNQHPRSLFGERRLDLGIQRKLTDLKGDICWSIWGNILSNQMRP
jgi:hypothetical protein